MLPTYLWGMPVGADFDNHFRFALPFYDELIQGNYVPGWLADSNNHFGDARFRFYPPNLYYLLCLFKYLTNDWYAATLIVFTLFSLIGTLGIYFWACRNLSAQTAILAAFVFAIIPYHLTQFYQASLLAEFAATSLLPFAFMFVEGLVAPTNNADKKPKIFVRLLNLAGLATVYSVIITTHLPTTVIASLSLALFTLLLVDWKNDKKSILFCVAGIALGLVSSSWYWVKMLCELDWIKASEKATSPYYDYRNNFVFSPFALNNLNTWYAGVLVGLTLAIFLPSLLILRQIFSKRSIRDAHSINNLTTKYFVRDCGESRVKRQLGAALVIAFISLLMTTELSRPLWIITPKLKEIQFPYRWLAITSVTISPTIGLSLQVWRERIKQRRVRPVQLVLLLSFLIALFVTAQDLVIDSDFIQHDKFLERIEKVRGGWSFVDWLPRGANELKDLLPLTEQVDAGNRKVVVTKWQSHERVFTVEEGVETQARIHSYYYPLWQAFIIKNNQKSLIETFKAPDGTLLVALPSDAVNIEIVFNEPPRTKISFIIAAFGWIVIMALPIICLFLAKNNKEGAVSSDH